MDNETKLPMNWKPLREAASAFTNRMIDVAPSSLMTIRPAVFADGMHAIWMVLLADLSKPGPRDFWARWLAEKVGLTVGATAPGWTYTAASGRDSVAVWQLSCGGRHWALCDYPPDIERVLGPPAPYGDMISVRNLPSDPAAALRAALLAVEPA